MGIADRVLGRRKQTSGKTQDTTAKDSVKSSEAQSAGRKKVNWFKISVIANLAVVVLAIVGGAAAFTLNLSNTNPQFCAMCHNMKSHVDSYLTGHTMDSVHARAHVGCKDCHDYPITAEVASLVKYITGQYDLSMPRRKFDQSMCVKCHISMAYEVNRTDYLVRNPHLNHWPSLKCGTCHLSHGEQVDYCSQCHDNGGQRMTGGPIVPRADNPWADPNHQNSNAPGS